MTIRFWALLLLIFGITTAAVAQEDGTVRGTVYDKGNGEPMIFTNVYIKGTTRGTTTDINGFYAIPNVPLGTYTLVSTTLGYDTMEVEFTLTKKGK